MTTEGLSSIPGDISKAIEVVSSYGGGATVASLSADLIKRFEAFSDSTKADILDSLKRLTKIAVLRLCNDPSVPARIVDEVALWRSWIYDGSEEAKSWWKEVVTSGETAIGNVLGAAIHKAIFG